MIIICITAALEADSTRQERVKKLVRESLFNLENETNSLVKARNSIENIERRRKGVEQDESDFQPYSNSNLPKRLSPEDLPADLRRYAEDIRDRLIVSKETRGLQGVVAKYHSLDWVLNTMTIENGGYLAEYEDDEDVAGEVSKILGDIDFDYQTCINLERFVDFLLRRTKQLKNWYWTEKTSQGHYRSTLLFSWLCRTLEAEVSRTRWLLKSVGNDSVGPIASLAAFPDADSVGNAESKGLAVKDHIMMDSKKASMLYKALTADDVSWLAGEMVEKIFVNRLTSSEGTKIKLHSLNQVRYIARKYIFPPDEGKTSRRITPEEWGLIRQVFDVEDGDMDRVNCANKTPSGYEKFEKHMKSLG